MSNVTWSKQYVHQTPQSLLMQLGSNWCLSKRESSYSSIHRLSNVSTVREKKRLLNLVPATSIKTILCAKFLVDGAPALQPHLLQPKKKNPLVMLKQNLEATVYSSRLGRRAAMQEMLPRSWASNRPVILNIKAVRIVKFWVEKKFEYFWNVWIFILII